MRDKKELINMVCQEIENQEKTGEHCSGICAIITDFFWGDVITGWEARFLRSVVFGSIKENNFFNRLLYSPVRLKERYRLDNSYFWSKTDFESRKNFLKYLAEKY